MLASTQNKKSLIITHCGRRVHTPGTNVVGEQSIPYPDPGPTDMIENSRGSLSMTMLLTHKWFQ